MRGRLAMAGQVAATVLVFGGALDAAPIRIMPLGDSITYGYSTTISVPGGYRGRLYQDLTSVGYSVQFVGSQTTNPSPLLPANEQAHEGHIGYLIDARATGGLTITGLAENVATWLGPKGADPNIILLMIGTNDIGKGIDDEGAPDRLAALITQITELKPNARVIVSTLIPQANASDDAAVQAFNASLKGPNGVVAQLQKLGEKVTLADIGGLLTTADLSDPIHPTQAGYNKIGDGWFHAIESTGAVTAPEPSTFVLFASVVGGLVTIGRLRAP